MTKKELLVSALENGTVIDHISQGEVFRVLHILGLENCENKIYLGSNLDSKKYGKKGILKVSNRYFKDEEINKIALFSPYATIIEIRDFEVVRKTAVTLPEEIHNLVKCMNPNCITNHQPIETKFKVTQTPELKLKCGYCEKNTIKSNMEFI
ncbi:MAG: aspartate carbamoyltransferase regulatory subunit [Bacteroidales bacterium]